MTQAQPQPTNPVLTPARITLEQYHHMVNAGIWDDRRVELLDGVVVEMSPEGIPHASKRTKAQNYLIKLLEDRAILRVGAPITLPNGSEPEPDLAIVQPLEDEYDRHHPYPENIFWIIEYSSTSLEKDLGVKAEIYAAAKIAEYWVVDLLRCVLIVFRNPVNGTYLFREEFATGSVTPLAFPEMAIAVPRLVN